MITTTQLKQTNLIFTEHQKLLNENNLLYKQLDNYEKINSNLVEIDSLKTKQLDLYKDLSNSYEDKISNLNKQIKKKETHRRIAIVSGIVSILTVLVLK